MTTILVLALAALVAVAILAFITLPAAVKIAVEGAVRNELAKIEQTALETASKAKAEIDQLENDAKDIVDKAHASLPTPPSI